MPKHKDTLDRINIPTPCTADWDTMVGNDVVRFCQHCNLSVHDLSRMTRLEATRLILNSKGKLCARYVLRPDGGVATTNPVHTQLHSIKRQATRLAAGAFTAALSLSSSIAAANPTPNSSPAVDNERQALLYGRANSKTKIIAAGGTLRGVITDPSGAVIAGATVTLVVNDRSGAERATVSNDEGVYVFQAVEEGSYRIQIQAAGFVTREFFNVSVRVNEESRLETTLEPAMILGGAVVMISPSNPLVAAVLKEEQAEVKELLATGAEVDAVDEEFDSTALAQAVASGNREIVTILLNAGADVNVKNKHGRTALMYAADRTSAEIIRDLINAGAKIELRDQGGWTALHHAVSYVNTETLQALIDAGAAIDARDEDEHTALMIAASKDAGEHVSVLLKSGATVNLRDKDGKTALALALEDDNAEAVKILKTYGAIE